MPGTYRECHVNVKGMVGANMQRILNEIRDLKYIKTKVDKYILGRKHRNYLLIPSFTVNLIPLNGVWCWGTAKHYTIQHCDHSFPP